MMGEMWQRVLIAVLLGAVAGYLLGPIVVTPEPRMNAQVISWLALPGNLFVQLLQFVVVPLVVASVVVGISESDRIATTGRVGLGMILYFLATTIVALFIGLVLAKLIAPGRSLDLGLISNLLAGPKTTTGAVTIGSIPDIVVGLIATNPIAAMVSGGLLQIFVGAAIFGLAIRSAPPRQTEALRDVFKAIMVALMTLVSWLMRLAPLAAFGLVAQLVANLGPQALFGLAGFAATVLLGLFVLLLFYWAMAKLAARRSPRDVLKAAIEPVLVAFATTSSTATLPVTLKASEEKLGVSATTARLVVPLGATFNTDGSVVFQTIVVVFLAQVFGQPFGMEQTIVLLGLTFATSFHAPGLPGGAIPILAVMLAALGIPVEGLALVMAVDRVLDMFRTSMNVAGDMVAVVVIDRWANAGPEKKQT